MMMMMTLTMMTMTMKMAMMIGDGHGYDDAKLRPCVITLTCSSTDVLPMSFDGNILLFFFHMRSRPVLFSGFATK